MPGVGLDFGTTNSTLAFFDGRKLNYLELDPLADDPSIMPSALYFNIELEPTVGSAAIRQYIEDNEGRIVRLSMESLGEIEVSYGELGMREVAVHARVDRGMPGQLFRGLKRWLGYKNLEVIKVLHKDYRSVALITPILEHIRRAAENKLGERIDSIHIGRPVHFEGLDQEADARALTRLGEAARHAGFSRCAFYPEPLGASLGYLQSHQCAAGDLILTFDFGGGTLDLALIRKLEDGFEILATHGSAVGGDRMDREIYKAKLFTELGQGAMVKTSPFSSLKEQPFRFFRFTEDLLNWNSTHALNTLQNIRISERSLAGTDEAAAVRLRRLKNIIQLNCSYSVHKAIEKAKMELSEREDSFINIAEIGLTVPLARPEFERIIRGVVREMEDCLETLLEKSGVGPREIDLVVRTGGSSLIPLVRNELESKFPGRVVEFDVFQSIAAGLAIADYHGYEFTQV